MQLGELHALSNERLQHIVVHPPCFASDSTPNAKMQKLSYTANKIEYEKLST